MKIARALLIASLAVPALHAAAVTEIRDLDLHVSAAPGGRRADFPSHRVWVGDHATVNALLFHDATLDGRGTRLATTFTTTAPTTAVTGWAPQTALLTGPFTHEMTAGAATFTTAGHYRLTMHFTAQGVNVTNTFDIDVVDTSVVAVRPPVTAACIRPEISWTAPAANGWICVDQTTRLAVSTTLRGCDPYTITFSKRNADGTWTSLGTHSGAPWTASTIFHEQGPVHLKAEIHDRNGASAEALLDATVGPCIGKSVENLNHLIKQLPPVDKCPACSKLFSRFAEIQKQFGNASPEVKLLPAAAKQIEQLEADVKLQLGKQK